MPEKKGSTTGKKAPSKKNLSKGQKMACGVCGLSVTIDEIGGYVVEEDSVLLCCGEPMKEKKTKAKAAK